MPLIPIVACTGKKCVKNEPHPFKLTGNMASLLLAGIAENNEVLTSDTSADRFANPLAEGSSIKVTLKLGL
jgi:hypothetical protein